MVALWLGPPQQAQRDPVARGLALVEELVEADEPPQAVAAHGEQEVWV